MAQDSFRIPFVVTYIISFAHLQVQSCMACVPRTCVGFEVLACSMSHKPLFAVSRCLNLNLGNLWMSLRACHATSSRIEAAFSA